MTQTRVAEQENTTPEHNSVLGDIDSGLAGQLNGVSSWQPQENTSLVGLREALVKRLSLATIRKPRQNKTILPQAFTPTYVEQWPDDEEDEQLDQLEQFNNLFYTEPDNDTTATLPKGSKTTPVLEPADGEPVGDELVDAELESGETALADSAVSEPLVSVGSESTSFTEQVEQPEHDTPHSEQSASPAPRGEELARSKAPLFATAVEEANNDGSNDRDVTSGELSDTSDEGHDTLFDGGNRIEQPFLKSRTSADASRGMAGGRVPRLRISGGRVRVIAAAGVACAVLAGAYVARVNVVQQQIQDCNTAVSRLRDQQSRLAHEAKSDNVTKALKVTDKQVLKDDAHVITDLKKAVAQAQGKVVLPSCELGYWDLTTSLASTTEQAAHEITQREKALTSAVSAVSKAVSAQKLASVKASLKIAVGTASKTLSDSDGNVADNATRDALKKAIDAAKKLLKEGKETDPATYSTKALDEAVGKVNASVEAKRKADEEAAKAREAESAQSGSSGSAAPTVPTTPYVTAPHVPSTPAPSEPSVPETPPSWSVPGESTNPFPDHL